MGTELHPETGFPVDSERPPIPEPTYGRRFLVGLLLSAAIGYSGATFIDEHAEHPADQSPATPVDPEP